MRKVGTGSKSCFRFGLFVGTLTFKNGVVCECVWEHEKLAFSLMIVELGYEDFIFLFFCG